MKIAMIGGTGLIGSKLVATPDERGHEAVPASPNIGVNTVSGEIVHAEEAVRSCWSA